MSATVKDLARKSTVIAGSAGLGRAIATPQVFSPELNALPTGRKMNGAVLHLRPNQTAFLCSLPLQDRMKIIGELIRQKPACIVVTGRTRCDELLKKAERAKVPVLKTAGISGITRVLVERLAPRVSLHGVLVQIFELGVLIIGESAVGKSEAALDLVLRGHKLVADDLVIVEKKSGEIDGRSSDMGADLLQIRGLGIINVRALYGESATLSSARVGLVVELEEWQKGHQYTLVGLRERRYRLLGVNLPFLKLPVKPGRNMATLIEVAARNQMLKNRGIFIARDLNQRILKRLAG